MYFRNYRLRKRWLYKCLKSAVSDGPSSGNMVKGPKHCLISTAALSPDSFIDHFKVNRVQRILS